MTMKFYILTFLISISSLTLLGQSNDAWTSFWNKDTTLVGYKDKYGVVKIEPKFTGFTSARKFENIIAVRNAKRNGFTRNNTNKRIIMKITLLKRIVKATKFFDLSFYVSGSSKSALFAQSLLHFETRQKYTL